MGSGEVSMGLYGISESNHEKWDTDKWAASMAMPQTGHDRRLQKQPMKMVMVWERLKVSGLPSGDY